MDPHARAESVWYRVAGLLRRKEIAIDIIEAEIRSAQHDALLEAAKLVLSAEPIEAARQLRAKAERTIKSGPSTKFQCDFPLAYRRRDPTQDRIR